MRGAGVSRRNRVFLAVGLGITLLLAGVLSAYASASPDGLERVAEDFGFAESAQDHASSDSPFADYSTKGVDDDGLAGGLAGVVGVVATLVVAVWLFRFLGRRR